MISIRKQNATRAKFPPEQPELPTAPLAHRCEAGSAACPEEEIGREAEVEGAP